MMEFLLAGFLVWFIILAFAILNGALRELFYEKTMDKRVAHQFSAFTFIAMILLTVAAFLSISGYEPTILQLVELGFIWLAMTMAFEFLFFHYVLKHPWQDLLDEYDLRKGRLWVLVLVAVLLAPPIIGSII